MMTTTIQEHVPDDLVVKIMVKLPVKSIVRFKCLSRQWGVVFSDSKFIRDHYKSINTGNHQDIFLLGHPFFKWRIDKGTDLKENNLQVTEYESPITYYELIQAIIHCGGILCMNTQHIDNSVVVWNPVTKEQRRFSIPRRIKWEVFGFGFDSNIDDYKAIFVTGSPQETTIECLRIKTGLWNAVRFKSMDIHHFPSTAAVLVDCSCLYWLGWKCDGSMGIISFDLESERMVEEASLYMDILHKLFSNLGLLSGSLCLMDSSTKIYVEFWIMKEDEVTKIKSWIKSFRVPNVCLGGGPLSPSVFTLNGRVLYQYKYHIAPRTLFLYDPMDESLKRLKIHGLHLGYPYTAIQYAESLLSLTG